MGEENKDASPLRTVHHLLAQGKGEEARLLLAQISARSPAQRKEFPYLQAWDAALQEQWESVAQQVRDMPVLLQDVERESLLTHGSLRRRRPFCLLLLGEMARELGYPEEAIEHFQHCLALLNERRMNIPEVRLLAHSSLGQLSLQMNQTAQALIQYETARNLCSSAQAEKPLCASILMGLCETYTRLEKYEQALATGKQALRSFQADSSANCREHLLLLLSRISFSLEDNPSALSYAREAGQVASQTNDHVRVARALLAQGEVLQAMCQGQQARESCQQALALLSVTSDQPLHGATLFLLGKIAEGAWRQKPAQVELAREAQEDYEQAWAIFESLHDASSLVRVSRQLAQLLEDRGRPELALAHWKTAYTLGRQRG